MSLEEVGVFQRVYGKINLSCVNNLFGWQKNQASMNVRHVLLTKEVYQEISSKAEAIMMSRKRSYQGQSSVDTDSFLYQPSHVTIPIITLMDVLVLRIY